MVASDQFIDVVGAVSGQLSWSVVSVHVTVVIDQLW